MSDVPAGTNSINVIEFAPPQPDEYALERQGLELVKAFSRISDPRARDALLYMAAKLAAS